MSRKLKILFVPIDAVGHVMAAVGMAEVLIDAGHQVIFAINDQWSGKLSKYGIEENLLVLGDRPTDVDPAQHWADLFSNGGAIKSLTPLEIVCNIRRNLYPIWIEEQKTLDLIVEKLLENLRPDVLICDQAFCLPSVIKSGIPWVLTCSFNPLMFIEDHRTPPQFGSGLPSKGYENEKKQFRSALYEASIEAWVRFNDFVVSSGLQPLEKYQFYHPSKWLNIYGYPKELDYTDLRPLPPNWYAFDNLKRSEKQTNFEIPVELREKSGKLIYFSLGSMGAADVENMKRLVAILAKSKHRFIVSKGPLHDTYELPDNMFGQQSVPQIQVLPTVDLVITHGGNNTVTETVYFGKPMIVMPLFGDQWDNAQRIYEKGFGLRFNVYNCTEEELLNGIENLLNDKELNEKLKTISKRIQSENSIAKLPKIIESIVENKNDFNNNFNISNI